MGYHMAGHMAKCHGHQCMVWNRTEAKAGRQVVKSVTFALNKNARPFNTPRSLAPAQWGSLSSWPPVRLSMENQNRLDINVINGYF